MTGNRQYQATTKPLPLQFVICTSRKCWTFKYFSHLFSTKTKVVYRPHVRKFYNFNLQENDTVSQKCHSISNAATERLYFTPMWTQCVHFTNPI